MNPIAVYICNYNGRDVLKKCLLSLMKQTGAVHFDIYVVDNASTDGSADMVQTEFGGQADCIRNGQNLGGAGGFNVGLRDAIKKKYPYIVLLDNDAFLAPNAIQAFYDYMEQNQDCGVAGAKIYMLNMPDVIQEFGSYASFDDFSMKLDHSHEVDSESLPLECECDYVPACAMMIRGKALEQTGIFPESNFIYWDDIEFGKRMRLAGYRVVAYGMAKAWHRGGGTQNRDTPFPKYYFFRNQWNFFAKYAKEEQRERLCESILNQAFRFIRGFHMKKMYHLERSIFYALNDFIYGVRGKAAEYKVKADKSCQEPLIELLKSVNSLYIQCNLSDFESENEARTIPYYICEGIFNRCNEIKVTVTGDEKACEYLKKSMEEKGSLTWNLEFRENEKMLEREGLMLRMCPHIDRVLDRQVLPVIWIDRYCNCILEEAEHEQWKAWNELYKQFSDFYRPQITQRIAGEQAWKE